MRRDTGTDDPRVRVRAGKRSRPRTKIRPDHSGAPLGRVIGIDRGRYSIFLLHEGEEYCVQAVRARELGPGSLVMGDQVRLTGDLSGRPDTLARIVAVEERTTVLRRSLEDVPDQRGEKVIVANAEIMVIVVALADPPPRTGMVDRCLVAASEAGLTPLLCLTKADLAHPDSFLSNYRNFDLESIVMALGDGTGISPNSSAIPVQELSESSFHISTPDELRARLQGHLSVFVGHSGVGKSTLINALVPDAQRATGHVNAVTRRGRHTSSSARAFRLDGSGWVVDTPGVRSFGLGHVTPADVLSVFPDIAEAATWCFPMCTHLETETSCALDAWARGEDPFTVSDGADMVERRSRLASARRLLEGLETTSETSKGR